MCCAYASRRRTNSLPNDRSLNLSKLKAFADDNLNVNQKYEICFGKGRKHCGKRRKCRKHCGKRRKYWLPAFFPFPTMFSEGFFLGSLKVGIVL